MQDLRHHAEWAGFRNLTDLETASTCIIELYGAMANRAAADCAVAALLDGRDDDHRFWTEVQSRVEAMQKMRRDAAIAWWNATGLAAI